MTPALPEKVDRNLAALGEAGAAWIEALPARIADLERLWNVEVGPTMPNATEAFVAEAVAADGEPLVVKLPIPGVEKAGREIAVLIAANGHGYVRLIEHDPTSGAMLLERLGQQLFQLGYPIEQQVETVCATLREAWRAAPPATPLMTGAEKAGALAATVRSVMAREPGAVSPRTIETALRFAELRRAAFDPAAALLGHGDAHYWNTLADPRTGGFKFVDPEGLFIEPAHDLSILLREGCRPDDFLSGDPVALGRARRDLLARLAGADPEAIWQWGLLEVLANGLLYLDVGSPQHAAAFLAVAEAWAWSEPS